MENSSILAEEFVANQIAYGVASDNFDFKSGNKLYDIGQKILRMIWDLEDHGFSVLDKLSMHKEPYVALGAAVGLLPLNETLAFKRLCALKDSQSPNAIYSAEMCMSEWKKGGMANIRDAKLEK